MNMSLLADDDEPRASESQAAARSRRSWRLPGKRRSEPASPDVTPSWGLLAEEGGQDFWYGASAQAAGESRRPDSPAADTQRIRGGLGEEDTYDWNDAYDWESTRERYYRDLLQSGGPSDGQHLHGQQLPGEPAAPAPDAFLRDAPPRDRDAPPRDSDRRDRGHGQGGLQQYVSTPQRLGGLLLALVSLVGVAIYVPMILSADRHSFTGVVSNSGVASLNFAASGRVSKIRVHIGQVVKKGRVLATEAATARAAAVRASDEAVAADKTSLTALLDASGGSQSVGVSAAEAKLASDAARLSAARMAFAETKIVAPKRGTVVAIYGQAGETAGLDGVRNFGARVRQQPRFSLFPSGPLPSVTTGSSGQLPVIALRTSGGWQVTALIPQSSALAAKVGEDAVVSVPAAGLHGVRGVVAELSPTPVSTSAGVSYQAVIRVIGHSRVAPLSGMTANVQLSTHPGGD